ncbi:MAG: FeoA domain-containing protein [Pleurocapsa sp.]
MIRTINLKHRHLSGRKQFKKLVFIGNISDKSVVRATKQLNLSPNSDFISQATVENSLLITEVHTDENIANQLKELKIKPGVTLELVSKTNNGSVVVSLGNKLVGIGAEIARKIVAVSAG